MTIGFERLNALEIVMISCDVFRHELKVIMPELREEFCEHSILEVYLEMSLHNDLQKIRQAITAALDEWIEPNISRKIVMLYGSMCHPEIQEICAENGIILPHEKNCIDLFLSVEEQQERSEGNNVLFLTNGWFQDWRNSLMVSGWDACDARMNFGRYDSFLLMTAPQIEYEDEAILELFDYTTVPIKLQKLYLDRFREKVRALIDSVVSNE